MELPADLVDQIARSPRDPAAYLVAADFLQQHGDPWGELIAVAHAHDRAADPATWRAELERCQRAIDGFDPASRHYRVDWHRGVVHRLVYFARTPRASAAELRDILASPIARLVREIIVVDLGAGLAPMLAELLVARVPALRSLRLIADDARDRLAIDPIAARFPFLERLQLDGVVTGALGHARLRTVELRAPQPELVYLELPALERLAWPAQPELAALASSRRFPALRRLAITATTPEAAGEAELTVLHSPLRIELAAFEVRVATARGKLVDRRFAIEPDADAPSAALISISGSHRYTVQPIHSPFTFGTHRDASVVLDGPDISAHQATIEQARDASWILRDHGAALATRLEGVPVERVQLRSGDELAIGLERYRFLAVGDDPARRAAAIASMISDD